MNQTQEQSHETNQLRAREVVASALARALADPRRPGLEFPLTTQDQSLLHDAWCALADPHPDLEPAGLGLGEVPPSSVDSGPLLRWLALEQPEREAIDQLIFGLVISKTCPPYETEYCHWKDPTYRAHQLADVAGFYRAFGVEPDTTRPERHDHVALELEFVALALSRQRTAMLRGHHEQADVCRDALAKFLRDHLVWWLPTFGRCLEHRIERLLTDGCDGAVAEHLKDFLGVALFLRAWVAIERIACNVEPSRQMIAPQVDAGLMELCSETCKSCL